MELRKRNNIIIIVSSILIIVFLVLSRLAEKKQLTLPGVSEENPVTSPVSTLGIAIESILSEESVLDSLLPRNITIDPAVLSRAESLFIGELAVTQGLPVDSVHRVYRRVRSRILGRRRGR